jgi:hypothetical protein
MIGVGHWGSFVNGMRLLAGPSHRLDRRWAIASLKPTPSETRAACPLDLVRPSGVAAIMSAVPAFASAAGSGGSLRSVKR